MDTITLALAGLGLVTVVRWIIDRISATDASPKS